MPQALVGTAGFLAAVLWMDLMFDVQVLGYDDKLPEDVLATIAGYYHHVTTAADPMGNVISLVMILTVLGAVLQLSRSAVALWLRVSVLALVLVPVLYAMTVVVPAAARLGARLDPPEVQTELARSLLSAHLLCLACVLTFLGLQVLLVQRLRRAAPERHHPER